LGYIILGCWMGNVAMSVRRLALSLFGPLEWGWRSLTSWRRQPMSLLLKQA
jgi:uncharacterized protein